MNQELLKKEITLKEDECCIIFDFGCYFPYKNTEVLSFKFQLGMEEYSDVKLNHRYPNRYYSTITKKYGRKVSKLGYPYIMKLKDQGPMVLVVQVGIKNKYISLIFPIETNMTKEKPICDLVLHYIFDTNEFCISSHERFGSGYHIHNWFNHEIDKERKPKYDIILETPTRINEKSVLYNEVITPYAQSLER